MSEIKKPPLTKKDREFFLKFYPKQLQAFHILRNQKTGELCYGGAAGGAKTYLGCAWQLLNRLAYPGTRGLIGRARLKNLKNTTLKTFLEIARSLGLVQGRHFSYNAQTDVLQFENGSEIYLKDLYLYPSDPDFTALGSLEITDAFIDEAGEVSEKAAAITQSRIRYRLDLSGLPPKMLLTCNPTRNWLYAAFYKAAKQLNISQQSIINWKKRGYIPIVSQMKIEAGTEGQLKARLEDCKDDAHGTDAG